VKLQSRIECLERTQTPSPFTLVFVEPGESVVDARARHEATHHVRVENAFFIEFVEPKLEVEGTL
jgi:hypothetical protein